MKRWICILIALLMVLCLPACAEETDNLVVNGDFSQIDASGMPESWRQGMWFTDKGVSRLYLDPEGFDGSSAAVFNADANDARFEQTLSVEPDTLYRFSCMAKAEGCGSEGYGATISFKDTFSYSEPLYDTQSDWQEIVCYGRTGAEQTELTLFLRVGGYGMLNTGRAWFDDVAAVRVDEAPEGFPVLDLSAQESSGSSGAAAAAVSEDEPARNTEAYLLLTLLYAVLILALARRSSRLRRSTVSGRAIFMAAMGAALALRIVVACTVRGYNTDINCFSAWSERMFANGPSNFYADDYFCDYPPGYMLLLWLPAALRNLLGIAYQGGLHLVLIKFMPIACDLLGAWLLYGTAKRRHGETVATALAAFYLFNPAALIDSAAWGQIDSVFTLLIALCALKASDEKYIASLLAFAAAMLIKPQAMLFAPLGLAAIVINLIHAQSARKTAQALTGVLAALGLIYAMAFLFTVGSVQNLLDALLRPVEWIIKIYSDTMNSYAYVTVNALNLYNIFGLNWASAESQPFWTTFAWAMFAAFYLYCMWLYLRAKDRQQLPLLGGLLICLIFTFGPMIHERYVFPALLLLALAYAIGRDRRVLLALTVLTVTLTLNEILVLQGGTGSGNYGHLYSSEQWLNSLVSLTNVINALYLAWVAFDICVRSHSCCLKGAMPKHENAVESISDYRLRLKKRDYILMLAVTALYAVVAFTNLGATSAPQNGWTSSHGGECVTFDLGETHTFRMSYYGGICNSTFTVELSNDGENWTEPYRAKYDQGEIFRWLWYVPQNESGQNAMGQTVVPDDGSAYVCFADSENPYPMQTARYVRITAEKAGLNLYEIAFRDEDGSLIDVQNVVQENVLADAMTDAAALVDEQDTVPEIPSYYNGTYFDEIYHARTAYELLRGMSIYEWTHPPLGKVLMMEGIRLFKMTPFGWRFMGALMGVLMLPLMYLLVKQLTKSSSLSLIAMLLLSLDSMHFTQTRIATIDSYAVFWIMLMYLFMIRYLQMDWQRVPLWKTLIPLGLCGITMGVACATKWICCYAAVGLAALFAWKVISEFTSARRSGAKFAGRFWFTVGFCVIFFIAVPLLIYLLSYFRQLRCEGVTSIFDMFKRERIQRVVQLQKSMFDYHAGLGGDTHYFRSPWYQWPVIWWPMWYFSGSAYLPDGMISSISCMGNPAVWWTGLAALIYILIASAWRRKAPRAWLITLIGFAAQFLPWVLVPRSTFIYHYFASVPFIIICTVLALDEIRKRDRTAFKIVACVLLTLALALFVAFYPLESGMPAPESYVKYLRWFKWYNY